MADGNTSWITATREAVDRASNVVQAQSDYEAIMDYDDDLDNALSELAQFEQAAVLGRGVWWTGVDAPPDLWAALGSAQKDLKPRPLASVVRLLTTYRTRVRNELQDAWKDYLASQVGDAVELRNLVQVLAGAEGLEDVGRELDDALGRLARLQKGLPSAEAVEALRKVAALFAALEKRLPASVKAFVSAAAHGGAPLELLDAEVREWLINNGAVQNFKVVPGRPPEAKHG